ncbi:hypothetical protein AAFF_G00084430 [Aldrovandia affinis]|uniref:Uncharacterized protein n=1 Tax=Aldrovandia affinis TaxID=143900 RepID=A0AAD7WCB7_9TELE|nr:hypothetical protein AAFF_G00084430 [Aldrovandia affinis]
MLADVAKKKVGHRLPRREPREGLYLTMMEEQACAKYWRWYWEHQVKTPALCLRVPELSHQPGLLRALKGKGIHCGFHKAWTAQNKGWNERKTRTNHVKVSIRQERSDHRPGN